MSMFNESDLQSAISQLAMCEFFPREATTQSAIMELLAKMCPHREALEWLVSKMVNEVGKWRGPAELRGVLCCKYRPSDGHEVDCASTPGFTPEDQYQRQLEKHQERKYLESPRVTALLPGDVATMSADAQCLAVFNIAAEGQPAQYLNPEGFAMPKPGILDVNAARDFADKLGM